MNTYQISSIGTICNTKKGTLIQLDSQFIPALKALNGFSHINVLWWFSDFDDAHYRTILETQQPYKNAPQQMGIFATRSPIRPNPIALTAVEVIEIDYQKGIIQVAYIDAHDNTPLLDIKPYTPSLDRIEKPTVPHWCHHWPISLEASASFDWENEFNF